MSHGGVLAILATLVSAIVVGLGGLQNLIQLAQLVLAGVTIGLRKPVGPAGQLWRRYSDGAPSITLMAPAYNEELTIVESVRSLLNLHYPEFEVVVVNDGSRDRTLEMLISAFQLTPTKHAFQQSLPTSSIRTIYTAADQPRLIVIDKANGGKADALNAAINIARSPLVCTIDADSILEPDALLRAVQPFIEDPERVIAVGGSIRIANGCRVDHGRLMDIGLPRNGLALIQTVEYLRAFLIARLASSELGAATIISGAFGLFDRQALLRVGGYSLGTVGEDMELVVKLHRWFRDNRRPYRMTFVPEPVCWTEVPETMAGLAGQRQRWQRGALETFFKHADMLATLRYGRVAGLGMTQVLVTDVLGPFAELMGYVLIPLLCAGGLLSWSYFVAFLAVSMGFGLAINVGGLALEEAVLWRVARSWDVLLLVAVAIVEIFGYRQLSNLWRVQGTWQFLRRKKGWGVMPRKGFQPDAISVADPATPD